MTERGVECRSLLGFKHFDLAWRRDVFCSLEIEIPISVLFTWPCVPGPKNPIISKVRSVCWRVSKPLTRIPGQNSSVADIGFCWPEFVQIAFECMLWCSWQRKKYLCLSVYLPLPFFEFFFHLRFIFITLFLSTINFSSPKRINWMKQQHWIGVELLKISSGFPLFLPVYWMPTVLFLNISFSIPCYLCHCFPHSLCLCDRQKQIKAFEMESSNLLSCAFVYLLLASVKTKWSQCGCHCSWMSILILQDIFHTLGSPEFTETDVLFL